MVKTTLDNSIGEANVEKPCPDCGGVLTVQWIPIPVEPIWELVPTCGPCDLRKLEEDYMRWKKEHQQESEDETTLEMETGVELGG